MHQIIPIGHNCLVAYHLKALDARPVSLPLDWALTENYLGLDNALDILQTGFEGFLSKGVEQDYISPDGIESKSVYIKEYDIEFIHQNWLQDNFEGTSWRGSLTESFYMYNGLMQSRNDKTFIFSSDYCPDFENTLAKFQPIVDRFEKWLTDEGIPGKLVIVHAIPHGHPDKDIFYEHFSKLTGNRRIRNIAFEIDDSDGVYGNSQSFQEILSKHL
jgi:hypothetical protein